MRGHILILSHSHTLEFLIVERGIKIIFARLANRIPKYVPCAKIDDDEIISRDAPDVWLWRTVTKIRKS